MTTTAQGIVDSLDFTDLFSREVGTGPKASFYVPTDVTGTKADRSATVLKNQINHAAERFHELGTSNGETESILSPIRELVSDSSYWRQQSRGLAIFAEAGFHSAVRIPIEVEQSVVVDNRFDVLPLVPVLESSGKCYILALAKNSVRLFDATRNSIEQLPLGSIPESFDEVVGDLPEQSLQFRAVGGGDAAFYGQGGTADTDSMLTEKFIRAVGKAVGAELGTARSQPLVLASVAEYLPIFRKSSPYPVIHDQVIPGSPEHSQPEDLRSAAWRLINDSELARESVERDRAMSLVHNGKGSLDPAEIAHAGQEGRIDTLYLPRTGIRRQSSDTYVLANDAVLSTVRTSGSLRTLGDEDRPDEVIATFRY